MTQTVSIDGEAVETEFDHHCHQNLLQFLEHNKVEVHYHCRDGYCGACRVKLNKGQITYIQGEPLAFIRPGEILTCCSIPDGDVDLSIE